MPFADPLFGLPSWIDAIIRVVIVILVMTIGRTKRAEEQHILHQA